MVQKCLNLVILQKKDIKKHNPNWPEIPDQPYRVLIIAGSGSGKKIIS